MNKISKLKFIKDFLCPIMLREILTRKQTQIMIKITKVKNMAINIMVTSITLKETMVKSSMDMMKVNSSMTNSKKRFRNQYSSQFNKNQNHSHKQNQKVIL